MMLDFFRRNEAEIRKMFKFGVTGVANTLVDVGVFTLLSVWLGLHESIGQCLGYGAGMLNSYLVNRSWTFRSSDRFFSLQLARFIITNLFVLAVSLVLLHYFMNAFGLGKLIAKFATTCITLVLNFIISRLWVFR